MEIMRTMMDFEFDTKKVQNTHFHQDLEILYVLDGGLEIQIESEKYELGKGDFLLINANKRHSIRETEEELLTSSFRINFSMLSERIRSCSGVIRLRIKMRRMNSSGKYWIAY